MPVGKYITSAFRPSKEIIANNFTLPEHRWVRKHQLKLLCSICTYKYYKKCFVQYFY